MKLNFLDLFCGAGGLSNGLESAGLNCLLGIDFLEPAIQTFERNHPNSIGIFGDIQKIDTSDMTINEVYESVSKIIDSKLEN